MERTSESDQASEPEFTASGSFFPASAQSAAEPATPNFSAIYNLPFIHDAPSQPAAVSFADTFHALHAPIVAMAQQHLNHTEIQESIADSLSQDPPNDYIDLRLEGTTQSLFTGNPITISSIAEPVPGYVLFNRIPDVLELFICPIIAKKHGTLSTPSWRYVENTPSLIRQEIKDKEQPYRYTGALFQIKFADGIVRPCQIAAQSLSRGRKIIYAVTGYIRKASADQLMICVSQSCKLTIKVSVQDVSHEIVVPVCSKETTDTIPVRPRSITHEEPVQAPLAQSAASYSVGVRAQQCYAKETTAATLVRVMLPGMTLDSSSSTELLLEVPTPPIPVLSLPVASYVTQGQTYHFHVESSTGVHICESVPSCQSRPSFHTWNPAPAPGSPICVLRLPSGQTIGSAFAPRQILPGTVDYSGFALINATMVIGFSAWSDQQNQPFMDVLAISPLGFLMRAAAEVPEPRLPIDETPTSVAFRQSIWDIINTGTSLYTFAATSLDRIVAGLLDAGLDPSSPLLRSRATAFHLAAWKGSYQVNQLLLAHRTTTADHLGQVDVFGATPLDVATFYGRADVAQLIRSYGGVSAWKSAGRQPSEYPLQVAKSNFSLTEKESGDSVKNLTFPRRGQIGFDSIVPSAQFETLTPAYTPLRWQSFVAPCLAACSLIREKVLKSATDIEKLIQKDYSWANIQRFEFGYTELLWKELRPRVLFIETRVDNKDTLIICFRETKGDSDWLTNVSAYGSSPFGESTYGAADANIFPTGNAHAGFWKLARHLRLPPLYELLKKGWNIIFTGFSQGSGVAEAALVQLMEETSWHTEWVFQVLFLGFASPLVFSESFGYSMLTDRKLSAKSELPMSDLFHHFVYKDDIVPRALTLVSAATQAATDAAGKALNSVLEFSRLSIYKEYKSAFNILKDLAKNLLSQVLPTYKPVGIYHLLRGKAEGGRLDLNCSDADQLAKLNLLVFKPWVDGDQLNFKIEHLQHHSPARYKQEIDSDAELGHYFAHRTCPAPGRGCPFVFSPETLECELFSNLAKKELELHILGPSVAWVDPAHLTISSGEGYSWEYKNAFFEPIHDGKISARFSMIEGQKIPKSAKVVLQSLIGGAQCSFDCKVRSLSGSENIQEMSPWQLLLLAAAHVLIIQTTPDSHTCGVSADHAKQLKALLIELENEYIYPSTEEGENRGDAKGHKYKHLVDVSRMLCWKMLMADRTTLNTSEFEYEFLDSASRPENDSFSDWKKEDLNELWSAREAKASANWKEWYQNFQSSLAPSFHAKENGLPPYVALSDWVSAVESSAATDTVWFLAAALPAIILIVVSQLIPGSKKEGIEIMPLIGAAAAAFSFLLSPPAIVGSGVAVASALGVAFGTKLSTSRLRYLHFDRVKHCLQLIDSKAEVGKISSIYVAETELFRKSSLFGGRKGCRNSTAHEIELPGEPRDSDFWYRAVRCSCIIREVRELLLNRHLVLVSGSRKVGKSSVSHMVFNSPTMGDRVGKTQHFSGVPISSKPVVWICDMPAFDDASIVTNMLHRLLWECASVGIIVTTAAKVDALREVEELFQACSCPTIILANQSDILAAPDNVDAPIQELDLVDLAKFLSVDAGVEETTVSRIRAAMRSLRAMSPPALAQYVWFASVRPEYRIPQELLCSVDTDIRTMPRSLDIKLAPETRPILLPRGILALVLQLLEQSGVGKLDILEDPQIWALFVMKKLIKNWLKNSGIVVDCFGSRTSLAMYATQISAAEKKSKERSGASRFDEESHSPKPPL